MAVEQDEQPSANQVGDSIPGFTSLNTKYPWTRYYPKLLSHASIVVWMCVNVIVVLSGIEHLKHSKKRCVNVWMRQPSWNVQTESSCGRRAQCWSRRRRRPRQVVGGSEWSRAEGAPVDAGHRIPLHWQPAGTGLERTRQRKYERSEKGEKVHTRIFLLYDFICEMKYKQVLIISTQQWQKNIAHWLTSVFILQMSLAEWDDASFEWQRSDLSGATAANQQKETV